MFHFFKSIGRFRRKKIYGFTRFSSNNIENKTMHKADLPPWKVVFYGTDIISEATLRALNNNRIMKSNCRIVQSLEVVCLKSDCAVRRYATQNGLMIHTWPHEIPLDTYDIGVVVSFGHMIPASSILACKYGIINAHPSLLPRWRGAAPIYYTILKGDEKTGVTITQVSPNKFDVGNILLQEEYIVPKRCTTKVLMEDLRNLAADMVLKTLEGLPNYIEMSYPQPTEGKTLARKIKPENGSINWAEESSVDIDCKFRAFNGFFDVYTTWKGHFKIRIIDLVPPEEVKDAKIYDLVKNPGSPGSCYYHKKRRILYVRCKDDWIGIKFLKIPNRRKFSALEFYNGFISNKKPEDCYFI